MFDDLQEQPVFAAPLPLLEPNVCEAMLVYVRNDVPFAQEVQFKSALSVIADLQKAAPDQGGEELAPQGKESIVVGGEEEGIVIQEEGIIVQEEEDWHESHESFPAPKDVSLPQDDDFVDDTEMQAPSEPDEPSSPARLPPWPSSPPLSKDEDHRSLEAAWLELAEAQEAHSQNLKQLALREQRVQQDAGLVAQADQTNRAEAHRLRLYHEDLVRREKAFSQREADLAQRETGFRQRENDLARDDQALSQREDRLDQRQRDLDRQGLLKGAAEATTTEDDLDSLRDILDRVQQGDYLTVSNIIAQHFQNRIFQSMDQSERKRRKPDHESTASSSSALAPLTSPTKPVRALPPPGHPRTRCFQDLKHV